MIIRDPDDAVAASEPVTWAIGELERALGEALGGMASPSRTTAPVPDVVVAGPASTQGGALLTGAGLVLPSVPEALVVAHLGAKTLAAGSDVRGLVYAVLELADRVRHAADPATALRVERPLIERPAAAVRSIARLFTSVIEDKAWWYDQAFWERYLTELITHRFNRFSLTLGLGYNFPRHVTDAYLHFSYPFLVNVPGYHVRVTGLSDEERERNLAALQFIGAAAKRRGLHFQLGLWTHAYEWVDSPHANHYVEGLTAERHAAYCRDALGLLLERVPTIDGVTFRVHGESGIPEGSYDFWRTVFGAVVKVSSRLDRPLEIDMHAKGIDDETVAAAVETGLPITISPKYWAEHQGLPYHQSSIREIERTAPPRQGHMAVSGGERRHTRYGYSDLLREGRPYQIVWRIWPGTQRLLLWGDPVFAAGYGRHSTFAGSRGVELCEPLTFKGRMGSGLPGGRNGYADESLVPVGAPSADWTKYAYTYRVWGRATYSGETDPDGWRRWLRSRFGAVAADAEAALANASRILLLVTTAFSPSANCKMLWPEMYTNLPLAGEDDHPYSDSLPPKRFGNASTLDPELFARVEETADELLAGRHSGKYSSLQVAGWLEDLASNAERHLAAATAHVGPSHGAEFRRWQADIVIQAALGHFFAHQLRAGVGFALYERTGDPAALREALDAYRAARRAYAAAADHGRVYRPDVTFGPEPWQRGHWADRLPAIDADIEALAAHLRAVESAGGRAISEARRAPSLKEAPASTRPLTEVRHQPPAPQERGAPVAFELVIAVPGGASDDEQPSFAVQLRYRHANQAEAYEAVEMTYEPCPPMRSGDHGGGSDRAGADDGGSDGGWRYRATIPGTYVDSPYPLLYFFRVQDQDGRAWIHPGFDATLANQPYYVLRRTPA